MVTHLPSTGTATLHRGHGGPLPRPLINIAAIVCSRCWPKRSFWKGNLTREIHYIVLSETFVTKYACGGVDLVKLFGSPGDDCVIVIL